VSTRKIKIIRINRRSIVTAVAVLTILAVIFNGKSHAASPTKNLTTDLGLAEPVMCADVVKAFDEVQAGYDRKQYERYIRFIGSALRELDSDGLTFKGISRERFVKDIALTVVHCRNSIRPISVRESAIYVYNALRGLKEEMAEKLGCHSLAECEQKFRK
jgi:hypothetical protein